MIKKIFLFIVLVAGTGCDQHKQSFEEKQAEIETGRIDESYLYECKEVGWKTLLPKEWDVITKKESERGVANGKDVIEKTIGTKIESSGFKQLVNLRKDRFNVFLSSIEPYDTKENSTYEEYNKSIMQMMMDTYAAKKIKVIMNEGKQIVGGLNFVTSTFFLYGSGSDSNKIILRQIMYGRLLNGYDFGMTLTYNNEKDKATLEGILKNSTFSTYK